MENEISILIIEDEALIAETIRMMLKDFGYHVSAVCYHYDTAMDSVKELDFDLVLSDINLGEGVDTRSGLEVMAEMRRHKNCPFIFLTAFDDHSTIRKAATLNPSAYLTKPVNSGSLYAAVQIAVENLKTRQLPELAAEKSIPDFFYVKLGKRLFKIVWEDVYCLEAVKNYVVIRTVKHDSGLVLRSSLVYVLEEMLPIRQRQRFVRISRGVAVDHGSILSCSEQEVKTSFGNFKCSVEFSKSIRLS